MNQETRLRGRNILRRKFLFKGPSRIGESPFEEAEISTMDEMGLSELEAHALGSCACSRTFHSPADIAAVSPITGEHMCSKCAETVCPGCLRVVSPITDMRSLFGKELCSDCLKHKVIKLALGSLLFLLVAAGVFWWLIR
jgi:hypothetical protein